MRGGNRVAAAVAAAAADEDETGAENRATCRLVAGTWSSIRDASCRRTDLTTPLRTIGRINSTRAARRLPIYRFPSFPSYTF